MLEERVRRYSEGEENLGKELLEVDRNGYVEHAKTLLGEGPSKRSNKHMFLPQQQIRRFQGAPGQKRSRLASYYGLKRMHAVRHKISNKQSKSKRTRSGRATM